MKVLNSKHYSAMPWKNGLGLSQEIAISPADASLQKLDFDWRLSLAHVKGENQFSVLNGYDRILTIFSGTGAEINGEILKPLTPLCFRGEDVIHCKPLGSEFNDIGIMIRRDLLKRIQAEMSVVEVLPNSSHMLSNPNHTEHFLFCVKGEFRTSEFEIATHDTLWFSGSQSLILTTQSDKTTLVHISITKPNP